jgi:transposase-like protein
MDERAESRISKLDRSADIILSRLREGATHKAIAAEIGVDRRAIGLWAKFRQVSAGGEDGAYSQSSNNALDARADIIRDLLRDGKSFAAIAREIGVNEKAISYWAKANCPCTGRETELCSRPDCQICHERSFASHPMAGRAVGWDPRRIRKGSHKVLPFRCDICRHFYECSPANATAERGCPYCGVRTHKICLEADCMHCYNRSFASRPEAAYAYGWNPRHFISNSNEKFPFVCRICAHIYESSLNRTEIEKRCPYCCVSAKKLCSSLECVQCYSRSFASSPRAANAVGWNPRFMPRSSGMRRLFHCLACDRDFSSKLRDISRGTWCPMCLFKTESLVNAYLELSSHRFTFNVGDVPNPIGPSSLRTDWVVTTSRGIIAIELDGNQHFTGIEHWGGEEALGRARARDAFKMLYHLAHDHRFIRLHQEDVLMDRFDWKTALYRAVEIDTQSVICLEANTLRDSWAHLREEVMFWRSRPLEDWVKTCGHRLSGSQEKEDTDEEGEEDEEGEME